MSVLEHYEISNGNAALYCVRKGCRWATGAMWETLGELVRKANEHEKRAHGGTDWLDNGGRR